MMIRRGCVVQAVVSQFMHYIVVHGWNAACVQLWLLVPVVLQVHFCMASAVLPIAPSSGCVGALFL
jgi:hypothetical protein